jgi:hypothetical protein
MEPKPSGWSGTQRWLEREQDKLARARAGETIPLPVGSYGHDIAAVLGFEADAATTSGAPRGLYVWGTADFKKVIDALPAEQASSPRRLLEWVVDLERRGWARPKSFISQKSPATLIPCVIGKEVGLVTVSALGELWFWRSVFERRAPASIPTVEAAIAPVALAQGRTFKNPNEDVLAAVAAAYEEAASHEINR